MRQNQIDNPAKIEIAQFAQFGSPSSVRFAPVRTALWLVGRGSRARRSKPTGDPSTQMYGVRRASFDVRRVKTRFERVREGCMFTAVIDMATHVIVKV